MKKEIKVSEPAKRIRKIREKLKLTRKEFWKLTGISPSTLYKIEIGESPVTWSRAKLFATLFIYKLHVSPFEAREEVILTGKLPDDLKLQYNPTKYY
jgi:transcriptional regulator with XRE-family HTH domain